MKNDGLSSSANAVLSAQKKRPKKLIETILMYDTLIALYKRFIQGIERKRDVYFGRLQGRVKNEGYSLGDDILDFCLVHYGAFGEESETIAMFQSLREKILLCPSGLILFLLESSKKDDCDHRYNEPFHEPGMLPKYLETRWMLGRLYENPDYIGFDIKEGIVTWPIMSWVECVFHNYNEISLSRNDADIGGGWCLEGVDYQDIGKNRSIDWLLKSGCVGVVGVGREEILERLRHANSNFEGMFYFMKDNLR